jgi:hypothetical protein
MRNSRASSSRGTSLSSKSMCVSTLSSSFTNAASELAILAYMQLKLARAYLSTETENEILTESSATKVEDTLRKESFRRDSASAARSIRNQALLRSGMYTSKIRNSCLTPFGFWRQVIVKIFAEAYSGFPEISSQSSSTDIAETPRDFLTPLCNIRWSDDPAEDDGVGETDRTEPGG